MTITIDAIDAERTTVAQTYETARDRLATLALYEIVLVAREVYPNAKWVQLGETDQDTSGGRWVEAVYAADGTRLADDGDDFDGVPTLDLDDLTGHIWNIGHCVANPPEGVEAKVYAGTYFLDIDSVSILDQS